MQYSQKYTLAAFLQPVEVGTEFTMTGWPMHITLADLFAFERNDSVMQKLAELLATFPTMHASMGDDAILGTTNVVLIEKSAELQRIHDKIVDLLELNSAKFNNPAFTRAGFLPHVTIQGLGRMHKGDTIAIHAVSLIDMFPDENWQQRKVLHTFKLSENKP